MIGDFHLHLRNGGERSRVTSVDLTARRNSARAGVDEIRFSDRDYRLRQTRSLWTDSAAGQPLAATACNPLGCLRVGYYDLCLYGEAHIHGFALNKIQPARRYVGGRYGKWLFDRNISSAWKGAVVPLQRADHVLLLCSLSAPRFETQIYLREVAFARELMARGLPFAVTDDPSSVFDHSVIWNPHRRYLLPNLWDYSRQICDFAIRLEGQRNFLFCSSDEISYWENKSHMHRRLDQVGAQTPKTKILTSEAWETVDFDIEPTLIKEEHSAGSAGIHYFDAASAARVFVKHYPFRPQESLIMQEVVRATKDLRLTIVGDTMIESASYWRKKTPDAVEGGTWTTTATTYNSVVDHGNIPPEVVPMAVDYLRRLGIRTAGIDLMWPDDDLTRVPVVLELSPYYRPNPPKPARFDHLTYRRYKQTWQSKDSYFLRQHDVFREIARQLLDQGLIGPES